MIERLVDALSALDAGLTAEELADALWLAQHLPRSVGEGEPAEGVDAAPAVAPRSPGRVGNVQRGAAGGPFPTGAAVTGPENGEWAGLHLPSRAPRSDEPVSGVPVRSPTVPALPSTLALFRALRPLNRTVESKRELLVDEEATAGRVADEGLWLPVQRPAPSRWLDLALVLDDSASMVVWRRSAAELRTLLERQGAFRDVRVWKLSAAPERPERLALRSETAPPGSASRSPRELIDPGGRRVVLLMSDCIGAAWDRGHVFRLLETWGRAGPVAVVQPLPQRLWDRCAPRFTPVRLRAARPGLPNDRLDWAVHQEDGQLGVAGLPVPVMEVEARWLAPWACMIAGTEPARIDGMALFTGQPPSWAPVADEWDAMAASDDERLSPLDRVLSFRAVASPVAFELAGYFAATSLSLPVMRLVQGAMLPGSRPSHLAEVFLSGLLRPVGPHGPGVHPDEVEYDFRDGVRELLLASLRRSDALAVLPQVSGFLGARMGSPLDFRALLANPTSEGLSALVRLSRPFALVAQTVLLGLGGRYAEIASRLGENLGSVAVPTAPATGDALGRVEAPTGLGGAPEEAEQRSPNAVVVNRSSTRGDENVSSISPKAAPERQPHPGELPVVWAGVPPRNPNFTGREGLLRELRSRLTSKVAAVLPHTLHGLGGVGKSQLAIEYAYRFAEDYDVVWWISAEEPAAVRSSLAALAPRLGLQGGGNVAEALPVVLDALRRGEPYRRWLLVFDNADQPEELTSLFPYGPGHILVTSRNQRWAGAAETIEVDVFDRDESVALLRQRGRELSPRDADRVAGRLGDLPLALEQAAAWQAETGMSVDEYLRLLDQRLIQLMSENPPGGYPSTVAATWSLALERLRGPMPASVQLLELCAFLAPEPVSWTLLSVGRFVALPAPLNGTVRDPILLGRAIREIGRYALARVDHARNSLHMHRLVQAVLREQLSPEQREEMRGHVHALLAAADPGDPDDPANWERYQGLWPHLAASSAVDSTDADARQLVLHQARCLFMRGDYESGGEFAGAVLERWRETLGKDHPDTLTMARHLGTMLRMQGEYETARALDEDTLARARKVFGEDHEETLLMVNNHSAGLRVLGEFAAARALDEDGLARARRVFGDEHPRTLMMANNLAVDMRLVGDFRAARTLDEDTFPKRRQVLGEDHPFTLFSVNNIARDLRECGEYAASATLQERTLARYRLRLGKDHPDAMRAAKNYAVSLRKAGAYEAARALAEENLTLYRRKFGDDHPDTLAAGTNLSNDRRLTGDLAGARTVAEDTLRRYRRVLGEEHPYTLACATNLATVLRAAGEHAAARAMDEDTLPRFRQVLGDDHPFTLTCASNLANDLNAAREHQAARALQEDTLTRFGRVLGEEHPYTLACASNLAVTLRAVREHAAARPLAEETVDKYREVLGPDHPDTAAAMAGKPIECDIEPAPW